MHSYEGRIQAIKLHIEFGKRVRALINQLALTELQQLNRWVRPEGCGLRFRDRPCWQACPT